MFDNSGQLLFSLLYKRTIFVYYCCFIDKENYRSGGLFKVTQSISLKAMPGIHLWHTPLALETGSYKLSPPRRSFKPQN